MILSRGKQHRLKQRAAKYPHGVWHKAFMWKPRRLEDGTLRCLEFVGRMYEYHNQSTLGALGPFPLYKAHYKTLRGAFNDKLLNND